MLNTQKAQSENREAPPEKSSISVPSLSLPKYQDAAESDIFILSEAEDLVPVFTLSGNDWTRVIPPDKSEQDITYTVRPYRPRVEGLFARIERWENKNTGEAHWRSVSKDNITSIYGKSACNRIADPQENSDNIDPSLPQERNRLANSAGFANRYLKCIKYGNITPRKADDTVFPPDNWSFH